MECLIAKKKGQQLYCYLVKAHASMQTRIVHQTYLGTAEKAAARHITQRG
jgi:hypothetical protein